MVNRWAGFVFVRHAETEMAGRFCGWADPGLNERGWAQVGALVERMRGRRVEVVWASDLERAVRTADAVAQGRGLEVEVRRGLREIGFGAWEGLTWAEVEGRDAGYARRWVEAFPAMEAPGGERFGEFRKRVVGEMRELAELGAGRQALVVTHAGVLRVVLREMCGVSDAEAWERTREYGCEVEGREVLG